MSDSAGRYALRGYKTVRARTFIKNQDAFKLYKGYQLSNIGGFYNEMNRREAQLILGVTEGSDQKVIKDRHRKLMLINHPDNGTEKVTQADRHISQRRSIRLKICLAADKAV